MALDDKTFQSAIAKINKFKNKQSLVPQVQVFEDPPHLRKPPSSTLTNNIQTIKMDVNQEENLQQQDHLQNNALSEPHNFKNSTNKSTKSSTKKSTEDKAGLISTINVVHKKNTDSDTLTNTKKGTDNNSYAEIENLNSFNYPEFVYQRPYDALTGIGKKIVDVIFEICRKYGGRETPPIPLAMLVRLCNEKKNSIKVTRQRLLDEGIFCTKNPSNTPARGRSGMLIYKLREDIFNEISESLSLFIRNNDLDLKRGTKQGTIQNTRTSSSSNYIKTTTTELPPEWKQIDLTPLKSINFGLTELFNIYKKCPNNITAQVVQDSINQFAFGMIHNADRYKGMNARSAVLVSSLIQGIRWEENNYISEEEKKRCEKEKKIVDFVTQQFKEPKFSEWYGSLNEEMRDKLVPSVIKNSFRYEISKSIEQKVYAVEYFDRQIWPDLLSQLIAEYVG